MGIIFLAGINKSYSQEAVRDKIEDGVKSEVVFVTSHYPPYVNIDSNGKVSGLFHDIITSVFEQSKYKVKYSVAPWKRCESILLQGKAFGAFPYLRTPSRNRNFNFTTKIAEFSPSFMYVKERFPKGFDWDSIADLKPYKLGAVKGFWYIDDFKKNDLRFIEVTNDAQNLKMLATGRIDATLIDPQVANYMIDKMVGTEPSQFGFSKKHYAQEFFRIMVSRSYKSSDEILKFINKKLESAQ